jgi:hypothetical protein
VSHHSSAFTDYRCFFLYRNQARNKLEAEHDVLVAVSKTSPRIQILVVSSNIFLNKIGFGTHHDPKFGQRWGTVSYISARDKMFRNAVPACVLIRNNLRNDVPARPVTKIPLVVSKQHQCSQ